MGSSAKKKREKKKDFQKSKLKVGKTKPKAANHTETSFRSKAIVLNQQSLTVSAPSTSSQFGHHISLLSSKSDSQRRESLAYLTTFITSCPVGSPFPQPLSTFLPRLYPLTLDGSSSVRTQLLKLFRSLPPGEIVDHVVEVLPYVRAGMTHLAADIRLFAIEVLCWLIEDAGLEVVSCGGGWYKTLNCFLTMLGWSTQDAMKWSSNRASFGKSGSEGRPMARTLLALAEFVDAGIGQRAADAGVGEGAARQGSVTTWRSSQHQLSQKSNAFEYLNLFGRPKDHETEMLEDREDRERVFDKSFRATIEIGLEAARRQGGEIGFGQPPQQHSSEPFEIAPNGARVNYEQFEKVDWSTVDVDPTDEEIEDAGRNRTLQKWAKIFTKYYEEVSTLIASRPGRQRWETTMAAMIQVIAYFFSEESGFDPAKLQYPVKMKEIAEKSADGKDVDLEALKAWDQKYAHLLSLEVYQRLNTIWDIWTLVMQHAQEIFSRAFAKDGYGRVHGSPWIEFVGLATVIAKQYKNMVNLNNSEPGADYDKSRFLIPVSFLRRYLRSNINKSGFRRDQKHWELCWDVVTEKQGLVIGKSKFMDETFEWPDEPELEIDVEREAESDGDREPKEVEAEEVDVDMAGTEF